MIRHLKVEEIDRIMPLIAVVQAVHAKARPDHFKSYLDPQAVQEFFADWMARANVAVLIAENAAGLALGYLMLEAQSKDATVFNPARHRGFVHHIAVLPAVQRQGIGSGLLEAGRAWFVARGLAQWAVSYWLFNEPSAALIAKVGLVPAHVIAEAAL